jgi:hypothetical protein
MCNYYYYYYYFGQGGVFLGGSKGAWGCFGFFFNKSGKNANCMMVVAMAFGKKHTLHSLLYFGACLFCFVLFFFLLFWVL